MHNDVMHSRYDNVAYTYGLTHGFYRAMHYMYNAKRGPTIACRLSVRLSVTLVDHVHIGKKNLGN